MDETRLSEDKSGIMTEEKPKTLNKAITVVHHDSVSSPYLVPKTTTPSHKKFHRELTKELSQKINSNPRQFLNKNSITAPEGIELPYKKNGLLSLTE